MLPSSVRKGRLAKSTSARYRWGWLLPALASTRVPHACRASRRANQSSLHRQRTLSIGVSLDEAGIHRESFASPQAPPPYSDARCAQTDSGTSHCRETDHADSSRSWNDPALHLPALSDKTSDKQDSNALLRTVAARSECRSSNPPTTSESSIPDRSKAALCGCTTALGAGGFRPAR